MDELPVDDLIRTSEETVALMWESYGILLEGDRSAPGWHQQVQETYRRCTELEARLQTLKHIRARKGSNRPEEKP